MRRDHHRVCFRPSDLSQLSFAHATLAQIFPDNGIMHELAKDGDRASRRDRRRVRFGTHTG